MKMEKSVENCYRQMYRGMIEKDREALSQVLDDSFVLVHMTGMRQGKEAFISAIENGTLNYYSADHERIEIRVSGNKAEMTGQSRVDAAVFSGGRHTWRLELRMKLIHRDDAWRITMAEASTY